MNNNESKRIQNIRNRLKKTTHFGDKSIFQNVHVPLFLTLIIFYIVIPGQFKYLSFKPKIFQICCKVRQMMYFYQFSMGGSASAADISAKMHHFKNWIHVTVTLFHSDFKNHSPGLQNLDFCNVFDDFLKLYKYF